MTWNQKFKQEGKTMGAISKLSPIEHQQKIDTRLARHAGDVLIPKVDRRQAC
jgi:hypothetical protein